MYTGSIPVLASKKIKGLGRCRKRSARISKHLVSAMTAETPHAADIEVRYFVGSERIATRFAAAALMSE